MRKITGNKLFVKALKEEGVDILFGYPGACTIDISDELYKQDYTKVILPRHEQALVHAADAYARSIGKVGVCLVTSGPGATNLVTGIATANYDSVPLVCFTGQVARNLIGNDAFQEVDIVGITRSICKYGITVQKREDLGRIIKEAFYIARTGRPGPVLIDIPKDVTANLSEYQKVEIDVTDIQRKKIDEDEIETAVKMIRRAKKPYIFVGGGAVLSGASESLVEFAHKIDAPVADSLMGKGAFPGTDELYSGMLGMHGTKASNFGVSRCDLLVVVGARFSDRVTGNAKKFAHHAKILQIDIDPAEIDKNILTDASVTGDIKEVLTILNEKVEQQSHEEWKQQIEEYKEKHPLTYHPEGLTGPYIVEEIYRQTNGDAIMTTEVGQHQMWAAQFYKYTKPRTLLTSGGLGTMGYGLGASLGAKMGMPDKTVVNIAGDGCFRMNMNEIATAARYNIPIIQVVVNNHVLGMVRQWQTLFYEKRYSATVLNDAVDFVKLAEAMGAVGIRAATREEFQKAFQKALAMGRPVVIDCQIDSDEKVWPMVAPGAAISEAFSEEDLEK
mgnify:CR=1 FL=1